MSIKVLIGTADLELASVLRAQIAELPDIEVIGIEKTSSEVLGVISTREDLDLALVDEEIGPLPVQELVREIAMRVPHGAAVLLSGWVDEEVLTRALEVGARGVLARRPSLEELQNRITAAAEWSRGMRRRLRSGAEDPAGGRRGRIIALAGAKGGTGTTTLAVQLALTAATTGSVCLVDLDLQSGDIPSYLDLVHRRSIVDLVGVAADITGSMLADALFVHESGPHVLLAPGEGERAEEVTVLATRQILGALGSRFDVVIVDCGAHMTEVSVTAIELADQVALTVTPDLPCLRAARRTAELWARLQARKDDDIAVVLVKQSRRSEIQPDFAGRVLGLAVARTTVPPCFRALEKAINNGTPDRVEDEGFRRSIAQLADELGAVPGRAGGAGRVGGAVASTGLRGLRRLTGEAT